MINYLKIITLCCLVFNVMTANSQTNLELGIDISPSIKFQTIRNKATGLFTSIGGYGFNVGLPIKYNLDDYKTISSGVLYEFSAFDTRVNTQLINSLRLSSVSIPVVYNHPITENYYVNLGGGINYVFQSKE